MFKDFSWSLISKLSFNIFSFILTPLLIIGLGDSYSVIIFFAAYAGFLSFVDGGYSFLIVKKITDRTSLSKAKNVFQSSETSLIYFSFIIAILSYFIIKQFSLLPRATFIIIIMGLSEGFLRIYMRILRSYSNARGVLVSYSKREVVYATLRFCIVLIFVEMKLNLSSVLLSMVIINVIFVFEERLRINFSFNFKAFKNWSALDHKFILTHSSLSLLASITVYLDKIIIKSYMTDSLYIDYMISHKFSYLLLVLSNPLSTILIRYFSNDSNEKLKVSWILKLLTLSIIIYFIIYLTTPFILKLWLGNNLNDNIIYLSRIFMISSMFLLLSQVPYSYFVSKSKNKFQLMMSIISCVFTFLNIYYYILTNNHFQLAINSVLIGVIITIIYYYKFYKHVFIKHNNTNIG